MAEELKKYIEPPVPWKCFDCGIYAGDYYVKDATWLAAWPDYKAHKGALAARYRGDTRMQAVKDGKLCLLLCLRCLQRRLDRSLNPEDFDLDQPIHQPIVLGMEMADRRRGGT